MADWLSCHNHIENHNLEIPGTNVNKHNTSISTHIPMYTPIEDTQTTP